MQIAGRRADQLSLTGRILEIRYSRLKRPIQPLSIIYGIIGDGYGYTHFVWVNDDQLTGGDLNIAADHADNLWTAHYAALLNINNALKIHCKGQCYRGKPGNTG